MTVDPALLGALIPRITTSRLVLRAWRRRDFDAYAECLADRPEALRVDRRNAWRMFAASAGTWLLDGAGWWAVSLVEDEDVLVGTSGVFRREDHPERESSADELEVGWSIRAAFRGRGFATEAARAALDFGIDRLGARQVIAHIDHDNPSSIRVAEKLGLAYEREVSFYGARLGRYATEAVT